MMKTSNTQIAVYNGFTIELCSMDLGGDSYLRHLYATFDVFMLIFPHFDSYQAVGQIINDCFTQV